MKRILLVLTVGLMMNAAASVSMAEDNDPKGSGSLGMHDLKVTKEDMHNVMKAYIEANAAQNGGAFVLVDEKTGIARKLSFTGLHERLGMSGMHHYSCADFTDMDSGEVLDVDIDIDMTDEGLKVAGAVVHKVDGAPRFVYKDNARVPIEEASGEEGAYEEKGSDKGSMKGSGYEM